MNLQGVTVSIAIIGLAVLMDYLLGDPPNKFHPTAWMGKLIGILEPSFRAENPKVEKIKGALFAISVICIFLIPVYVVLLLIQRHLPLPACILVSAILLKLTFAVKSMKDASLRVITFLRNGDVQRARKHLSRIVRRDTSGLDQGLMLSATVECVAESTVDGVTSPLFYFALFGVPGAVVFRVVNTLDSMIGYKDPKHVHIGWFSAKLDTLLNFIPARLTAYLIVISASLVGKNSRNSWRILRRDRSKTESVNAGWPMSAMAGALGVRLEKPGHYVLGDGGETDCKHVIQALQIMMLSVILFLTIVVTPLCLWRNT